MEIAAISTVTSRINNQYNGNLKQIFQSIVNDRDNCSIVVSMSGAEQTIPVVNGQIASKLLSSSTINLINSVLGAVTIPSNSS